MSGDVCGFFSNIFQAMQKHDYEAYFSNVLHFSYFKRNQWVDGLTI